MTEVTVCTYRCPRWEELPALGLYLDQVMLVLEEALGPISTGPDKSVITPTIINNYVKQKVLTPTEKKKYNRGQLADLIMIALLKRVLSTTEIVRVLQALKAGQEPQASYDAFCTELEHRLNETVLPQAASTAGLCPPLVQAAVKALAGKILFELLLEEAQQQEAAQAAAEEAAQKEEAARLAAQKAAEKAAEKKKEKKPEKNPEDTPIL